MRLEQLLKCLDDYEVYPAMADYEVRGISPNSKKVSDGFIFVAIKGVQEDGHNFIDEAIKRGAKAIIIDRQRISELANWQTGKPANRQTVFITSYDTRRALAKLVAEFFGRPSDKLKIIGVTGTNGKTTITYLIEAILIEANFHPAVIGTINYRFQDKIIASSNTTPGSSDLQAMLRQMLDEGADFVVMEVSSHALDQARVEAINFAYAIFTNLTLDHLDYHKTLEDYFQAKSLLFQGLTKDSCAIINSDDEYGRRLVKLTKARVTSYGVKYNVDILAEDIRLNASYTDFILKIGSVRENFRTPLIGRHNVYNILASIAFAINEGLDIGLIKRAIEKFAQVPGRLERIDSGRGITIFVDYAHTPDALRNAISTLREISKNKVIVVFGCGGERDTSKRPKMGEIVTELADYAVITNDNPRSEDPLSIIKQIKAGIKKNNYCVAPDRKEAIKKSLSLAKTGDIVLIAGKGHENYQLFNGQKLYFDDCEAVRECLG